MSKLSFTKLGLNKELLNNIKEINYNEQIIEIRQYLPVNDKLILISNVINSSYDRNNFYNPIKVEIFSMLNIIEKYTNITFTEKQKEDPCKLYDLLESSGLINLIINEIPKEEYETLIEGIENSIKAIYKYKNSLLGILENVSQDYSNLNLDATEIQKKLNDPNNLEFLKDVLTKLG